MDCFNVPDNRILSFCMGFIACLVLIFVGWVGITIAGES